MQRVTRYEYEPVLNRVKRVVIQPGTPDENETLLDYDAIIHPALVNFN